MALDFENHTQTNCFLRRILPDEGIHQATKIKNGRARNLPCGSLENLTEEILKCDQLGQSIYHACAAYENDKSRKAENTKSMKALWLDIDCGAEKAKTGAGYHTKTDAALALRAFCNAVGLPKPMIVDSGGGLHVYWPLQIAIGASRWKELAVKLKQAIKARGFLADQSRTADAASILRPVGTYNRKYDPPRRVSLLCDAGDQNVDALEAVLDSFLNKPKHKQRSHQSSIVEDTPRQRARLASMLEYISADCEYEIYRNVVWALLSLGWGHAPDLAQSWCLTAPDRFTEDNFTAIVNGHDPNRSASIGTLIRLARQGGWHG
ncbi:hypothetical protein [Planktotalea arctica]|uniref:hypothetical protein n=1 Tax=Planktotalea arctica TaxID=1481893 RepID=UPI00111C47D0|nr:hypothetical protein [Planktotalea arctica]